MAKSKKKKIPPKDDTLKIHGSFSDVIGVSVGKKPEEKKVEKKKKP